MTKFIVTRDSLKNDRWENENILLQATNVVEAKQEVEKLFMQDLNDKLFSIEEYEYQNKLTDYEFKQELNSGKINVILEGEIPINYTDKLNILTLKQTVEYSIRLKEWRAPVRYQGVKYE